MSDSAENVPADAQQEDAGAEVMSAPEPSGPDIQTDGSFLAEVEGATGQSLSACFQCRKCSAGCPLKEEVDYFPNQILRMIQFGMRDEVLRSKSLWLCVSCETCTQRCPNGVDLAAVMDYLRFVAIKEGVEPADPKVAKFHQSFLETLKKYGRSHEADMIRRYKFKTGTLFEHMGMGMEMFKKGKIKIVGKKIQGLGEFRELMDRYRSENG